MRWLFRRARNGKDAKLLKEIKSQRKREHREIEAELGDILDSADLFHARTCNWHKFIGKDYSQSNNVMTEPLISREAAVQMMAMQTIETFCDLYNCLRAGLHRPVPWILRKQYETRTNALLFRFDESGQSAFRYLHWQLADDARLNPNADRIPGPLKASLELFGHTLEDRIGNKREHWAELPDGRKFHGIGNRAAFVAKSVKDNWPKAELSEQDLDRLEEQDLRTYSVSNTIVHPSVIGHLNMIELRSALTTNSHYLTQTLVALREVRLYSLSVLDLLVEDILWNTSSGASNNLSEAIEKAFG